jgi:carboxypeptidase Taq
VILRYELEKELFAGRLSLSDLPEAWDARMRDYLGLSTIDNPSDGPMQDVHWPSGGFGYFPSYTLGAMMAAQQWAAIIRDHPGVDGDIEAGRFDALNDWRRERIWSQASKYSTPEILERATGEPLNAVHFVRHLEARYLS